MSDDFQTQDQMIEGALRTLFRPEDAPTALSKRILASAAKPAPRRRTPMLGMAGVAVAAAALITASVVHEHRVELRQEQLAGERLAYALQLTTQDLNWAEQKVNQDLAVGPGKPEER
ncbi:MAG TPA: hypothetical protein VN709_10630 [Terriglobales bacterium]|nr:hypothetical protein [Terriglobales bacterium]